MLKGRRDWEFRGEVKKTLITVCEAIIHNFNNVKRGHPQCVEKISALY